MKLHALKRRCASGGFPTDTHDLITLRASGDFKVRVNRGWVNHQRVVARGDEWVRQTNKESASIVMNGTGLAVHCDVITTNGHAVDITDRLVTKADTERRNAPLEMRKQRAADAGLLRRARAGRDHQVRGGKRLGTGDVDGIIADDFDAQCGINLTEALDEVPGERVIVVNQEEHSPDHRKAAGIK